MKLFLVIIFFIISCSFEKKETIYFSIPYYSGCEKTISKMSTFFKKSTEKTDYKLRVEIKKFDMTPYGHMDIIGVVNLVSEGNWKTLSGKTPLEYLELEANSIKAECMPNNYTVVSQDNLIEVYRRIGGDKVVIPRIIDDKVFLYYNDGSFSNQAN